MSEKHIGKVIQVIGPVLDIQFKDGELPELLNAIEIDNHGQKLVVEALSSPFKALSCASSKFFSSCNSSLRSLPAFMSFCMESSLFRHFCISNSQS